MAQRAPLLPGTGARGPSSASATAHSRSSTANTSNSSLLNGGQSYASGSTSSGPPAAAAVNGHAGSGRQDGDNDDNDDDDEGIHENGGDQQIQPKANGAGPSRHGFDSSEETLRELESRYFLYYTDVRLVSPTA